MTTDDFTATALAEAERRWPRDLLDVPGSARNVSGSARMNRRIGFDLGARWARTDLAAQEPTDAEIDAVAASILWETSGRHWEDISDGERREYREYARAALSAARAARRDEEKR